MSSVSCLPARKAWPLSIASLMAWSLMAGDVRSQLISGTDLGAPAGLAGWPSETASRQATTLAAVSTIMLRRLATREMFFLPAIIAGIVPAVHVVFNICRRRPLFTKKTPLALWASGGSRSSNYLCSRPPPPSMLQRDQSAKAYKEDTGRLGYLVYAAINGPGTDRPVVYRYVNGDVGVDSVEDDDGF